MTVRTIMIKGDLTDDELLDIIDLMQVIQQARPQESFDVVVDSPDTDQRIEEILSRLPLAAGYERIKRDTPSDPEDTSRC